MMTLLAGVVTALLPVIVAILNALAPAIHETPTAETSRPTDPALRDYLRRRVREAEGRAGRRR